MDFQPASPERRHPVDYRDEIEHAQVTRIPSVLPEQQPARLAYATGVREPASLSWLVADRRDLVAALVEANLAAYRRTPARQGCHFRP